MYFIFDIPQILICNDNREREREKLYLSHQKFRYRENAPKLQSPASLFTILYIEDDDDGVVVCPDVQDVHKEGDDDDDGGV